jgi:hypothetical protein
MSKKPKVEHDYDAGKDKLTITIHRYSLKSKKTRGAIMEKLMANLGKQARSSHRRRQEEIKKRNWQRDTW